MPVGALTRESAVEEPKGRLPGPSNSGSTVEDALPDDLVGSARDGDENAMQTLLRRVEPQIRRSIQGWIRSPDDIDELVQETMIRAWKSVGRFQGRCSLPTWLFRIARSTVTMFWRSEQRRLTRMQLIPAAFPAGTTSPHEMLEESERLARVIDMLATLPGAQLDAVLAVAFRGMTAVEASTALGVRSGTIRSSLHKARQRLLAGDR